MLCVMTNRELGNWAYVIFMCVCIKKIVRSMWYYVIVKFNKWKSDLFSILKLCHYRACMVVWIMYSMHLGRFRRKIVCRQQRIYAIKQFSFCSCTDDGIFSTPILNDDWPKCTPQEKSELLIWNDHVEFISN